MEEISLRGLLPCVFRGMEETERIRQSEVWLSGELRLTRGCRVCIQAESGGGKSSLLSFIYGNRTDYLGQILFDAEESRRLSVEDWCELRTRHLALLPQELRLFPELSVMQNLQLKNRLTDYKTEEEMLSLLERLGIREKARERVGLLSVGQQQRVAIVRAVCQPFDFLLLDEPVSHLDQTNNLIAASIVEEEATRQGAGIVTTSVGNPLRIDNAVVIQL
ncbi:MAG: ATP-binding cassette domain-containing protein [Prevotellaceae bacterium]|nr:ATP-binding cassette domain-containing protein [Prevotellaceae bacterium]